MRTTVFRQLLPVMLLLALVQGAASAQDRDEVRRVVRGGVVYEIQGVVWKCTGYDSSDDSFPPDGVITILSELENVGDNEEPIPITEIVNWAFNDQSNNVDTEVIHGVVISEGIKTIGQYAFNRCVNITHITLPSTIEFVGEGAFHCGDNLRWVDCRQVKPAWNNQLSNDDYISFFGPSDYLMNLKFTLLYMPSWWKIGGTNVILTDASGNRSCQEFHYSRNMDYCVPDGFTAAKCTVLQKLAADEGAYSVCLPYSLPVPQGAKAYSLRKRNDTDVCFSQITGNMEPFKPYLIVASENVALDCDSEQELLATEDAEARLTTDNANGVTIYGTLKRIGNTAAANGAYYVLQANNEWKKVTTQNSTVTVPPYRVFLTLDQAQSGNLHFSFYDAEDAITVPTASPIQAQDDRWNTIHGQQLDGQPTTKGVFIHNGRKVVVR